MRHLAGLVLAAFTINNYTTLTYLLLLSILFSISASIYAISKNPGTKNNAYITEIHRANGAPRAMPEVMRRLWQRGQSIVTAYVSGPKGQREREHEMNSNIREAIGRFCGMDTAEQVEVVRRVGPSEMLDTMLAELQWKNVEKFGVLMDRLEGR